MELQASGVVLVKVEVRTQRPRLVPRPVPAAHHVVRPLDPPGLGVEPLDVRLHLRPELAHVGALVVRPSSAPVRGQGILVQLDQRETFWRKFISKLCRQIRVGPDGGYHRQFYKFPTPLCHEMCPATASWRHGW